MTDQLKQLGDKLKALAGNWAAYTAMGSFGLYLLGYLALRFHLTVLGIGTDLAVLDERYLFFGVKFLVYLVSSVPIFLLILLVVVAVFYLPYRLLPLKPRTRIREAWVGRWQRIWAWWSTPFRPALTGIVIAVILIQLVMRQGFFLSNLLVASHLPEPKWLQDLLLTENEASRSLFFCGLVAGVVLTGGIYMVGRRKENQTAMSRFLNGILAFLVAVQLLFLPVNYGILIADKTMPRVADLGGQTWLDPGQEAWLAWEGQAGLTFVVRDRKGGQNQRSLVTLPRRQVSKIVITGYDSIRYILLNETKSPPEPRQAGGRKTQ